MSLGMTYSPIVHGGGAASYKLWSFFAYSNGYWEVYIRFLGDLIGLGVGLRGGGYMGGSFLGGIFHGGGEIQWKGAGFSSITIKKKNNENINMKKFFQLKVRRSIKTQNKQRLLLIWGVIKII